MDFRLMWTFLGFQSAVEQPSDVRQGGSAAASALPGETGVGRQPHPHRRPRRLFKPAAPQGTVSDTPAADVMFGCCVCMSWRFLHENEVSDEDMTFLGTKEHTCGSKLGNFGS